jgi:nucleoside phosphorylase/HEAT repeat protein
MVDHVYINRMVRSKETKDHLKAAELLNTHFSNLQNKELAWQDLQDLTRDKDNQDVRYTATVCIGEHISQIPDTNQAWQDLVRLTKDSFPKVRLAAASSLVSAFSCVSDKNQAWKDLIELTQDEDSIVRMYAYHSLGRASVLKATEAENGDRLLREIKAAIRYFEKSSQEEEKGPARFCLPFYRSYFAIIFQDAKEDEVKRYLNQAKIEVGRSDSKAELIEAVENLAKALQESQKMKTRSIEEISNELNAYRWYCDKAANHMAAADESAPGAVKLMRKCNPLLEEKIQATIAEIQKSAKQICQATLGSGTKFEASAAEIHRQSKVLSKGDLVSVQNSSSRIVTQLLEFCKLLSEEEKGSVCDVVKEIAHTSEFPEKLHLIEIALSHLNPILEAHRMSKADVVILSVLPEEYCALSAHLMNLQSPPDMGSIPNIYAWQFGEIACPKFNGTYKVAIGMTCRPGNNQSALAVKEAIQLWRPRYIIFSGIAGGLPDPKKKYADLKLGYVVIADVVYGYEYGKIDEKYEPRGNWTKNTDQGLLTSASAYAHKGLWQKQIIASPPKASDPRAITGEIASGEKVVDDRTNEFFAQVLKRWPKIKAVEMEGAGVGSAIEQAQSLGIAVGFMVIRGISDLLLAEEGDQSGGTGVRDDWKAYASGTAAAFTTGWIADGLPLPPLDRSSISS